MQADGVVRQQAKLLHALRTFFHTRGFLEIQPRLLLSECIVDPHIDPIRIASEAIGLSELIACDHYLQTSPELAMKRSLCREEASIYSIGPVFRAGESGKHHRPEFTMLEWYEVGANMAAEIDLLGQLACAMLDRDCYDVVSYQDLFMRHAGFDPLETPTAELSKSVAEIDHDLALSIANDRDQMLDVLLSQRVQPAMSLGKPLIVFDYPLSQAALAKPSPNDSRCAARFELFVDGVELANGYDELLDAEELLRRTRKNNARRVAADRDPLPEPHSLVEAMRTGMPPCSGVALGVDRLLMMRLGTDSII